MSAEAFWACSPRAVVELYNCAKQSRSRSSSAQGSAQGSATKRGGQPAQAVEKQRLGRIPR